MKKKGFLTGMFGAALAFGFVLTGCQTAIPVTYTEPARLNMSGVNRIVIDSNNDQVATYISQQLTNTGKYTVATDTELQEWKQWWAEQIGLLPLAEYQNGATEISPADLVKAYTDNAARADSSYQGHALKISGVVAEIQQSGKDYVVRLGVGNNSVDVYFRSSEVQKIASVNKGQEVTIFGDCNGFKRPNMADTAEILRILGAGEHVNITDATFPVNLKEYHPGKVDTVILLNTTSSEKNESRVEEQPAKDSNGNLLTDAQGHTVMRNVTIYDRIVTVTIKYDIAKVREGSLIYDIVNPKGGFLIGQGTKSETSKSSNEDRSQLAAVPDLAAQVINASLKELTSEMVPTSQSLSVTLAKSDSKDKEVKKATSNASKLVKAKDYAGAALAYGEIYAQYKDFAAGFNQAVLTEVAQGTETAIGLIEALAKSTDNPAAQNMLRDMQQRNAANQQAAQQLSE